MQRENKRDVKKASGKKALKDLTQIIQEPTHVSTFQIFSGLIVVHKKYQVFGAGLFDWLISQLVPAFYSAARFSAYLRSQLPRPPRSPTQEDPLIPLILSKVSFFRVGAECKKWTALKPVIYIPPHFYKQTCYSPSKWRGVGQGS